MTPFTPSTSVIVVTWNNLSYTVRCVEALLRTRPADTELIFVDNGSTDGTVAYLGAIASRLGDAARLIALTENLGWCGGVNRGLEAARGQYLVLLNNDVVVTTDWIQGLRECLDEAHRELPGLRPAGIVGPVTNSAGGPQQVQNPPPFAPQSLDTHALQHRRAFRRKWSSTFFLSGFCMMLRRELYLAVGGLDESFFPGGYDDNDLVLRAQERGFECVIAGDVYVHHEGSVTFDKTFPEMRRGLKNIGLFHDKWRARRAGKHRLVAAYRVKDAESTLRESLDATARFADAIVILDDGSSDSTPSICQSHPAVSRYERQDLPFDERRDRNHVLQMAAELDPDWIISIDSDEVFEMDRPRAERLMQLADPHVKAIGFHWYTFWEPTRTYFRADGVFGGMSGHRMYRHEPGLSIVRGTDKGLHCGNIPELPDGCGRYSNVRVRHLGYDSEALRQRKLSFYRTIDEKPRVDLVGSSDYGHLVSRTVTLRHYAPEQGVSLCIITRNEEQRLERFLSFFEPFVSEICIVDNGSTDDTVAIARRFTDKIRIHPTDRLDLAEVRNVGLAMATQPWILSLDPDEEIGEPDLARLVRLMDDLDVHAYAFEIVNHQKDSAPVMTIAVRLFRNDPRIRYGRAVHETVEPSLDRHPELVVRPARIGIQHHGFLKDDDDVESKLERYLEANQRMREEDPVDPMPWYNEALHLMNDGRDDQAILFLERAIALSKSFLSPRSNLAQIYQYRALALWQSVVNELGPDHPVRSTAEEAVALLGRITPPRNFIGRARRLAMREGGPPDGT